MRRALNINLASDVLIFDEAHNIERVCADAASFDLSSLELAGAVREVDRLLAGARNRSDDDSEAVDPEVDGLENANGGVRGVSPDELVRLRQLLLAVDESVAKVPLQQTRAEARYVAAGEELGRMLGAAGIDGVTVTPLVELCERCVDGYGDTLLAECVWWALLTTRFAADRPLNAGASPRWVRQHASA